MFKNLPFSESDSQRQDIRDMYRYQSAVIADSMHFRNADIRIDKHTGLVYHTLPSKKTQYVIPELYPERSVTPDITRGLSRKVGLETADYNKYEKPQYIDTNRRSNVLINEHRNLGKPVQIPQISQVPIHPTFVPVKNYDNTASKQSREVSTSLGTLQNAKDSTSDTIKISPIDPRNSAGFKSSTPQGKQLQESKAVVNLESRLLSPKKSTMSNDELYAVIHKSKKKMNIENTDPAPSVQEQDTPKTIKSPETGYIGDKSRSRLSWSPGKGEYVDFNTDIDKISPPNDSRSRQSWACSDRKGTQQTSRLDFKKLLLQHGKTNILQSNARKLSAVEQLKISKQQIQQPSKPSQSDMSILEYSGSPRSLVNRKLGGNNNSPRSTPEKARSVPKLLSPRSQWRFASPRSDVLSSTILEDCREDESPNSSAERKEKKQGRIAQSNTEGMTTEKKDARRQLIKEEKQDKNSANNPEKSSASISQRIQAQRAKFFSSTPQSSCDSTSSSVNSRFTKQTDSDNKCNSPPTLETAF